MKHIYLILVLLSLSNLMDAQVISGLVNDKNGNSLPYVSIGIVNGNRGTISDESGFFMLDLTGISRDDTLRFSSLGYSFVDFIVSSVKDDKNLMVVLEQKAYLIDGIEVRPLQNVEVEFGSRRKYRSGYMFSGIGEGFELAQLFSNKRRVILKKIMFRIESTGYDSILFRLNIYHNENGFPDANINKSDIFVISRKKGWISKDVSIFIIQTDGDFFVSVEAIKGWKDSVQARADIVISGKSVKDGGARLRLACLGKWETNNLLMNYYILAEE